MRDLGGWDRIRWNTVMGRASWRDHSHWGILFGLKGSAELIDPTTSINDPVAEVDPPGPGQDGSARRLEPTPNPSRV